MLLLVLFKEKYANNTAAALFGKEYFSSENFTWVALMGLFGIAKTNNALENFNKQIADILMKWKVHPLLELLEMTVPWV